MMAVRCADPSRTFEALLSNVSEALTAAQQHSAIDFLQVMTSHSQNAHSGGLTVQQHCVDALCAGQALSPSCRCACRSSKL